mgnify:CR=1 FL=1
MVLPAQAQSDLAEGSPPLTAIAGIPRPTGHDLVRLTDGTTLTGTVANASVMLHTAYGSLSLNVEVLAAIEFDRQPRGLDRVTTVNRNRLGGFVNEPIELRDDSGEITRLNKAAIQRIMFQQREAEADHVVTRRFLVLHNGDLLSGEVRNWNAQPRPGASAAATGLDNLELARFKAGSREVALNLRNGAEQTASLPEDVLAFELDLGLEVRLPIAQLKTLHARSGTLPLLVRNEFADTAIITADESVEPPATTPEGMVWIKPGRFQLGSSPEEKGHGTDEDPPTEVVITRGFWMGQHEVTQAEYSAVMGNNPSGFLGDTNHPVERVTWNEANAYCVRKTVLESEAGRLPAGFVYRLPTEAEWEDACRAGTTTRFTFGDDLAETELLDYAWFINNSDSSTHPVGRLKPNPWGLYDLHGNVWEWCQDLWQDAYPGGSVTNYTGSTDGWLRVARGGSWLYDAAFSRSANRDNYGPDNRCSDIGFRVVLAAPL